MVRLEKKYMIIQDSKICWYQSKVLSTNKPSLFFMHGIASQAKHWFEMSNYLFQYYNLYIIDRPGYGESNYIRVSSIEQYVELMRDIISALDIIQPTIYIGHSMGSYIGLKLALQERQLEKLILLAPFIRFSTDEKLLECSDLCKKKAIESLTGGFAFDVEKSITNQYLWDIICMDKSAIWNDFILLANSSIKDEELKKICIDTLVIHAVDDGVVSIRKSYNIARKISNVKLYKIERGGHNFFISSPHYIADIINKLVKEE